MRFSMQKDSLLLLFSVFSLSPFLTIFVHKSPIIFEENIFKMHFFHSLRLLFVLRAFYALQSILELQYKVVLSVRVPRTNTSYFVWIFRE